MLDDDVCPVDGVPIGVARSGVLVHLDELPKGTPDHTVDRMPREAYEASRDARRDLTGAVGDLLLHHMTLHPGNDCEWVRRVREALS